ncbi:MAG: molybdenum cofactor guanylyltransferase [Parasporobacterium sp.]|nr:molybdenum cofactor guanylyltransferase [Parasporobacterium sp.]
MKSLVILAGGKSSRMGQNKVFLEYKGETFLERIAVNASAFFDRIYISADSEEHISQILAMPRIKELNKKGSFIIPICDACQGIGPMGGLMSVMEKASEPLLAVIPVDVPDGDMETLSLMWNEMSAHAYTKEDTTKALLLADDSGRVEPLIGVYKTAALENFRSLSAKGRYKIVDAFSEGELVPLTEEKLREKYPALAEKDLKKCFCNINTMSDYVNLTSK